MWKILDTMYLFHVLSIGANSHMHLFSKCVTPFNFYHGHVKFLNVPVLYDTPGITKRLRLSWLTNSALVYEPECGRRGEVAGSQPMSTAVHMEPK